MGRTFVEVHFIFVCVHFECHLGLSYRPRGPVNITLSSSLFSLENPLFGLLLLISHNLTV